MRTTRWAAAVVAVAAVLGTNREALAAQGTDEGASSQGSGLGSSPAASSLPCPACRPAPGARSQNPETTRRIVVSLPDRKLAVIANGQVVAMFPVAVGAPSTPSPTGTFTITDRIPHPTYYAPGKIIGPGARNPLGTRWLGLSVKGYGIHGTDSPASIGHARSHGCIRLRNRDIEALFDLVQSGDRVEFQAERTAETAALFSASPSARPQPASGGSAGAAGELPGTTAGAASAPGADAKARNMLRPN